MFSTPITEDIEISFPHLPLSLFFLLWGAFSSGVLGYSNGKISVACGSMVPSHGHIAQNSAPPYAISTSKTSFAPGDEIIGRVWRSEVLISLHAQPREAVLSRLFTWWGWVLFCGR
uniref:Reelin domain-containing protein n=1 Tax=Podarcis muralis TaxID=64176 RepID=A0A670IXT8_PODMU